MTSKKVERNIQNFEEDLESSVSDRKNSSNDKALCNQLINFESFESVKETVTAAQQTEESKVDGVADQIIKAFIVKKQKHFIELEKQEDVITYEESEQRLIALGQLLSFLLSIVTLIQLILLQSRSVNLVNIEHEANYNESDVNFPIAQVALMAPRGSGSIIILRLDNQSKLKFAWHFKVPRLKTETRYFLFEHHGNICVIYNNPKKAMTIIHGPKKHTIIQNSQIRKPFEEGANNLRVGNFVMVFGGYQSSERAAVNVKQKCSSKEKYYSEKQTTEIWSIKKQVWIKVPFIPLDTGCAYKASGFAVNRSG